MVHATLFFLAQLSVSCLGFAPAFEAPGAVLAQPQPAPVMNLQVNPQLQLAQVATSGAPVVQGVRAVMQAVSTAQQVAATGTAVQSVLQVPQKPAVVQVVQAPQVLQQGPAVVQLAKQQVPQKPAVVQVVPTPQAPVVQAVQSVPVVGPNVQQTGTAVVGSSPVQVSANGNTGVQNAVTYANAANEAATVAANAAVNANAAATNAANVVANLGRSTVESDTAKTVAIAAKQAAVAANEAVVAANTAANQAAMASAVASQATVSPVPPAAVQPPKVPVVQESPVVQGAAPVQEAVPVAAVTAVPSTPVATVVQVPESTYSTSQWYFSQAMQLIYGLTFAMIIKGLCVAGNVLVQVSPISQVKRWESRSCTGEADAAPYVSIAFGGWQWCFYGLFAWIVTARSGFLILVQSNCLGALLGSYYVVTFYRNCRNDYSLSTLQRYLSAVTSLALLQVCALSVLPAERALFLTGLISSFCSFIGATSVLVTVPQVIRQKDSRSIPGPYAFANLLSSGVWSLCGYILDDPMVMIPNIFSTCCAMVSLGLKVVYPSEGSDDDVDKQVEEGASEEMQDRKVQLHAKKAVKMATEFTPMLPTKPLKDISTFPEKLSGVVERLPLVCGTVSECGTGGTF